MSVTTLRVSPADLVAAGALLATRPTSISPLDVASAPAVIDAATRARLVSAGVMNEAGLTPAAHRTLEGLANARAVVRLLVSGGDGRIDVALYQAADRRIALTESGDSVRLRDPADSDALLATIWHHVAASAATATDFDVQLPADAALTLLAAIDVVREARLAALAGIAQPEPVLDGATIVTRLAATARPSLALLVGGLLGAPPPDAGRIATALPELERRGSLERSAGRLGLAAPLRAVANGLAVLERTVHVRAASLANDGGLVALELGAAQGNGPGVLLFERGAADQIHLRCASTNELIAVVGALLDDVGGLRARPVAVAAADPKFCAQCGKSITPNAKFCGGCGIRLG